MGNPQGDWIWYELMTPDPAASTAFYGPLFGWDVNAAGPDNHYHIVTKDGEGVAGFLTLSDDMQAHGAAPGWLGYIGVDDVDAKAAEIKAAGGTIHRAPWDIPGFGRAALVADPDGTVFYIMKGSMPGESTAFAKYKPTVGHCAWNELMAKNADSTLNFYTQQFGWERADTMEMGDMGLYRFIKADGLVMGAAMDAMAGMPTGWSFYLRVANIDDALDTITLNGGRVLNGPIEIPGGEFTVNAIDPQGAMFAIVGARS